MSSKETTDRNTYYDNLRASVRDLQLKSNKFLTDCIMKNAESGCCATPNPDDQEDDGGDELESESGVLCIVVIVANYLE